MARQLELPENTADYESLVRLSNEAESLRAELEKLYEEWEKAGEEAGE